MKSIPGIAFIYSSLFFFASIALLFTADLSAKDEVVQCANLIYAGNNTSRCFSDEFLSIVQRKTAISTERRFKSVKLDSEELFKYPFAMMTGEADFIFSQKERENLKRYLASGGFMLVSAGCSSRNFDQAFRREIKAVFKDAKLESIPIEHPLFRTVNDIRKLELSHESSEKVSLEGLQINGKIVLIYSRHGLNDTANTRGCCCCGGNELRNASDINVNILVYALLH